MQAKVSVQVEQAAQRVKEGMTTQQQAHVFHKEGKSYFDAGDMQGALECFNISISLNPMAVYYVNRAACYKNLNKHTEAYFDYSFAIRLEPESGALYCQRGLCAAKLERLTLALEDLDEACRFEPLPLNFYCRASLYADTENHDLAVKDLTRVIDDMLHTAADLRLRSLHRRGAAYFELGHYQEAKDDLALVCQLDTKHVAPFMLMGKVLKVQGALPAAEGYLNHAIVQQPEMQELYVERADIRMRMGTQLKRCEAIVDFDYAIALVNKSLDTMAVVASKSESTAVLSRTPSRGGKRSEILSMSSFSRAGTPGTSHSTGRGRVTSSPRANEGPAAGSGPDASADHVMALAEIMNKRAQAKLLLEEDSARRSALRDALESVNLCPQDEFFKMVAAVCYQRLFQTSEALALIESVLLINPENERALFHQAFCRREKGQFMESIDSLTKIIALNQSTKRENGAHALKKPVSMLKPNGKSPLNNGSVEIMPLSIVPISQVYEMRGAIFHGLKAYKMAVKDLGFSIAAEDSRPEPYFLRADCHCKLGSYEQALDDFLISEERGFRDHPALLAARGAVYRLLGNPASASRDFELALEKLRMEADLEGSFEQAFMATAISIRLRMFVALCHLDQKHYDIAHKQLLETLELLDGAAIEDGPINARPRLRWTILYHDALSSYMRRDYSRCLQLLLPCVDELRDFAPDPIDVGAALFFCGVCKGVLGDAQACLTLLNRCLESEWISIERHMSLCLFGRGKALQRLGRHDEAVSDFIRCIEINSKDAHALFRRAWSYKALGKYELAALDFELAKELRFDDPNFSIQYKLIRDVDYMELDSEPDLVEPFPTLLPLPGHI